MVEGSVKTEMDTKCEIVIQTRMCKNQNESADFSSINREVDYGKHKILVRNYFHMWYKFYINRKEKREMIKRQLERREKLDTFVRALKKYRKEQEGRESEKRDQKPVKSAPVSSFKNRCEAQKSTIQHLTMKLEAKDRLIEQLKLGIFESAAREVNLETKFEIREIFADCSTKTRCKLAPPVEYNEKFMVTTQKAPKLLQEFEARALERAKRREIIQERKRIIETTRKRIAMELVERKRVQDEEEKKKNLELIKEKRMKQLELEKRRRERKQLFMEKWDKAVDFHRRKLLTKVLQCFRLNYLKGVQNYISSLKHYRRNLLQKSMNIWKDFVEEKYSHKYMLANQLFRYKTIARTFQLLYMVISISFFLCLTNNVMLE